MEKVLLFKILSIGKVVFMSILILSHGSSGVPFVITKYGFVN